MAGGLGLESGILIKYIFTGLGGRGWGMMV